MQLKILFLILNSINILPNFAYKLTPMEIDDHPCEPENLRVIFTSLTIAPIIGGHGFFLGGEKGGERGNRREGEFSKKLGFPISRF